MKLLTRTYWLFALLLWPAFLPADDYSVTSPDGHLTATVHLTDGKLSYSVSRDDRVVVE